MKLTPENIKSTTRLSSAIFIIYFAAFFVFDIFIRPTTPYKWAEPLAQSLLFLIGGIGFTFNAVVYGIAAWKMSENEYYEMLASHSLFGITWGLSWASKTYWRWQNRLLMIPATLMGLAVTTIGIMGLYYLIAHTF